MCNFCSANAFDNHQQHFSLPHQSFLQEQLKQQSPCIPSEGETYIVTVLSQYQNLMKKCYFSTTSGILVKRSTKTENEDR